MPARIGCVSHVAFDVILASTLNRFEGLQSRDKKYRPIKGIPKTVFLDYVRFVRVIASYGGYFSFRNKSLFKARGDALEQKHHWKDIWGAT